jgi:hypothetical protein
VLHGRLERRRQEREARRHESHKQQLVTGS